MACRMDELMKEGLDEKTAGKQARREFGNQLRMQAESRDAKLLVWLEATGQDLRYGVRTLLKSPSFTAITIFTLALGIGANTAMFSVVYKVLLSPLPYPDSHRLICLFEEVPSSKRSSLSYPNFVDWREMNHSFSSIAGYHGINVNVAFNGDAEHLPGEMITAGLFELLGVTPLVGRTFQASDDRLDAAATIMISERLWKRKFASTHNIIGQTLMVDGTSRTIIGIVPASFHFPLATSNSDVYTLMGNWNEPRIHDDRGAAWIWLAVGRLKPGVTIETARADL